MRGDILCQARSGMGKTCVFVISVLQNIKHSDHTTCIVFSHTREMAIQITREFIRLGKYLPDIVIKTVFGGVPLRKSMADIKSGCDILVGTAGRIADLVRHKALDTSQLKFFVVDECDRQIETLSTRADIQEVFRSAPLDKQVLMFTATLSENAKTSCLKYMRSPLCIEIDDKKLTLHGLTQYFTRVTEGQKNRRLTEFLDNSDFNQAVIYVSSSTRARALQKLMTEWCFPCIALTANMPVEERMRHFIQFKEVKTRILITTQVMGRGVDVEKVNMVVNYDFPPSSNDYLHRVGRAGRFGTNGVTMSFVSTEEDEKVLAEVESRFETHMHEIKGAITKEALVV